MLSNHSKMDSKTIAKLCGETEEIIVTLMNELEINMVYSLKEGCVYNRRMIREQEISEIRKEAGIKGLSKRWGKKYSKTIAKRYSKTIAKRYSKTIADTDIPQEVRIGKDRLNKEVFLAVGSEQLAVAVKKKYLEFVMLTEIEYQKLIQTFGQKNTDEYIKKLNNYIGSKNKKYKSHYHTILVWNDLHKGSAPKGDYNDNE